LLKKQQPEVLGEGEGGLAVLHAVMSQPLGGAVSSVQGVDLKQTVKVEELAKLTFLEV